MPMELHAVHYNSNYDNQETALHRDDGVTILVYFFQVAFYLPSYFYVSTKNNTELTKKNYYFSNLDMSIIRFAFIRLNQVYFCEYVTLSLFIYIANNDLFRKAWFIELSDIHNIQEYIEFISNTLHNIIL